MKRSYRPRFPLPTKRRWRVAIYIASLLMIALACELLWVRSLRTIHPSAQTTRWTSPLHETGEGVNFLEALNAQLSQNVRPQDNGFAVMLPAIGVAGLENEWLAGEIARRAGVAPPRESDALALVPIHLFTPPADTRAATRKSLAAMDPELQLRESLQGPWQAEKRPVVSAWIDRNLGALELYHRATRCPRFYAPLVAPVNTTGKAAMVVDAVQPTLERQGDLAQLACARALRRAGGADWSGARADLLAVHRHARLAAGGSGLMVEYLAAIHLESLAARVERALIPHMPAEQLRALAADLQGLAALPSPARVIDLGERALALDAVCYASRQGVAAAQRRLGAGPDQTLTPPGWLALAPVRYDDALRSVNAWYDQASDAMNHAAHGARRDAVARVASASETARNRGLVRAATRPGELMLATCAPPVSGALRAWERARAELRVTASASLLAAQRAGTGSLPASFSAGGEISVDPFTDRTLLYHVDATGAAIYSVGPNLRDDNGADGDDIAARVSR